MAHTGYAKPGRVKPKRSTRRTTARKIKPKGRAKGRRY